MSQKNLTEQSLTLGALLRLPYDAMQRGLYAELARRGYGEIRPAHSAVFRTIEPEGSRIVEMAERAHMTKQSMAYLVESLESAGYVAVTPDPDDRRAKRVRLTERGKQVQREGIRLSQEWERTVADRIGGEAAITELRRLLQKLRDATEGEAVWGKASEISTKE
jgi:DNA-binding MarR family transcriptional regulator